MASVEENLTEDSIFRDLVALRKKEIIERILPPSFVDGVIDIEILRKELRNYTKEREGNTVSRRVYNRLLLMFDQSFITQVSAGLNEEHKDLEKLTELMENVDITESLQGTADPLPVEVAQKGKNESAKNSNRHYCDHSSQ